MPAEAGGVFVSGGTAGNLSALIAARHRWRTRAEGRLDRTRGLIIASKGAHSSIAAAGRAMDADVVDRRRRRPRAGSRVDALRALVDGAAAPRTASGCSPSSPPAAPPTPASSTTSPAPPTWPHELGVWFHVDGAYGGAGLAAPSVRDRYDGIERADSFIVDPHKWLFAPFDCCALALPRPACRPARAHTQHAEYLDVLHTDDDARVEPQRLRPPPVAPCPRPAVLVQPRHLRHRRLPRRRRDTRSPSPAQAARLIDDAAHLELIMEPELSVVLFRRTRLDARAVPGVERPAARRRASRSWCPPRGRARPCCASASSTRAPRVADIQLLVDSLA